MMCPCKDCGEREIGCHARCAGYAEWKAEAGRIAENRAKIKRATRRIPDNAMRKIWHKMKAEIK